MYQGFPFIPCGNQGYSMDPTQTKRSVKRVHGKEGANAFQLGPDESVLLLDDTAPIVWFKATDSAGYPMLKPYDISPHVEEEEATPKQITANDYQSLEERISKLERRLNNGKSYSGNSRQSQPSDAAKPTGNPG